MSLCSTVCNAVNIRDVKAIMYLMAIVLFSFGKLPILSPFLVEFSRCAVQIAFKFTHLTPAPTHLLFLT